MASEKTNKKLLIAGAAGVVGVIVVLIGVIVYLAGVQRAQPDTRKEERGRAILLTKDNIEEFESKKDAVEDGYYLVTMNNAWSFDDGKSESIDAYVANAPQNTRTVYFEVFLSDTGEMVYSSPYMPVGTELQNFSLEKDLKAGDYTAVVAYHLVDDEFNEIDDVSVEITIHILN